MFAFTNKALRLDNIVVRNKLVLKPHVFRLKRPAIMAVQLTYKQEELIHNIARECCFENFVVDANIGTCKGDNYLGVITTIALKEKDNDRIKHFILKSAHTHENFRREALIAEAFYRETYIYNTILPRLFQFQIEKSISDSFSGAAKYYGCSLEDTNESILLENLKENGYKLWSRKIPMDDTHVTVVFSEYARFHAASLAFKEHHPDEFNLLTKELQQDIYESRRSTSENEALIETYFTIGLNGTEGNIKATKALERLRKKVSNLLSDLRNNEDRNKVVIHGDGWCNNMLFKYKDNSSTPTKVCFIDWQISKVGSPILDLAFFFSVCSAKDVIEQLPKYLQIYHKILTNNLKEFDCEPETVFSFDTLMEQWKKYSWYGVFMALMLLKVMLLDSEEAPNITEIMDKGKSLFEALDFHVSNTSEYKTRLCDLLEFMADNDYI